MSQVKVFDPKTQREITQPQNQTVAVADRFGVHMLASARKDKDPRYEGLASCRQQRYGVCF